MHNALATPAPTGEATFACTLTFRESREIAIVLIGFEDVPRRGAANTNG